MYIGVHSGSRTFLKLCSDHRPAFGQVAECAMATTTLALYWNLSSVHKKERLESSVKLVSALEQFQDQFTVGLPKSTGNGDASNEGSTVDVHLKDLDSNNAADVSYAIKRLIRGLASPRDSSRQGFAVALTEVR